MDAFVTTDQLRAKLGLDPNAQDNDDTLASAIQSAQFHIQTVLNTQLELNTGIQDLFQLDPKAHNSHQPNRVFRLWLTQSILTSTVPVVEYCPTIIPDSVPDGYDLDSNYFVPDFMDLLGPVTWSTVPSGDYFIDKPTGIVKISNMYRRNWVRVTYDAGLEAGDSVPDWMTEAVLGFAPIMLVLGAVTKQAAGAKMMYQMQADHATAIMAPYLRNRAFATMPFNCSLNN